MEEMVGIRGSGVCHQNRQNFICLAEEGPQGGCCCCDYVQVAGFSLKTSQAFNGLER